MQNKTINKILDAYNEGLLTSDDGAYDWSKENHIKFDDMLKVIANHMPDFQKCWGCKHIEDRLYSGMQSQCTYCSRRIECHDHFEKDPKRYRDKEK